MDQQSSYFPVQPSTSDLDKLIHNYEFENQQHIKLIENENQHIEVLQKSIAEDKLSISRLQENIEQLDEETKRSQKQFTYNKDNCESLKKTMLVLKDHEEALAKKLEVFEETAKQEQHEREEILSHYSNIWDDYQTKYQNFPMAIELQKQKEKNSSLETQLLDSESQMNYIKLQMKQWNEENDTNLLGLNNFIVSLIKLKIDTEKVVSKIKHAVLDKKNIEEKINKSKEQMELSHSLQHPKLNNTETAVESELSVSSVVEQSDIQITLEDPDTDQTKDTEETTLISMCCNKEDESTQISRSKPPDGPNTNQEQVMSSRQTVLLSKHPQNSTFKLTSQLPVPVQQLPGSNIQYHSLQQSRNLPVSNTQSHITRSELQRDNRPSTPVYTLQVPRLQQVVALNTPSLLTSKSVQSNDYLAQNTTKQSRNTETSQALFQRIVVPTFSQPKTPNVSVTQNFRVPINTPPMHMNTSNHRSRQENEQASTNVLNIPMQRLLTPRIPQPSLPINQSVTGTVPKSQPNNMIQKPAKIIQSKANCHQNLQQRISVQPNVPRLSQQDIPMQQLPVSPRTPVTSRHFQKEAVNSGQKESYKSLSTSPALSPSVSPQTPKTPNIAETTDDGSPFDIEKHQQRIQSLSKSPGPLPYSSRLMFSHEDDTNDQDTPAMIRPFFEDDNRFMPSFGNTNSGMNNLFGNNTGSPDKVKSKETFSFGEEKNSESTRKGNNTLMSLFSEGDKSSSDTNFSFATDKAKSTETFNFGGEKNSDSSSKGNDTFMSLFGEGNKTSSESSFSFVTNKDKSKDTFSFGGENNSDQSSKGNDTLMSLFGDGNKSSNVKSFSFGNLDTDRSTRGETLMSLFGSEDGNKVEESDMQETRFSFSFGGGDADGQPRGFSFF